ncbi:MAG: hypothetical protein ABI939_04800 [Anaerolineaceae bacterium]
MTRTVRMFAPVLLGLCALIAVGVARADGEAGLVIQNGDSVDTYCVPFAGESINGADLLKKVSIPVARVGDLVCAVGNVGCFGASDYESCTCKYASTGTYWAYFSQTYGQRWVYSGLSFALLKSKDGDMQAWRWGPAGANSAPPPPPLSFEAVCGHPPRKAVAETTQPPSTPTNAVAATATRADPTVGATPTGLSTLTETATAATVMATVTQSARPPSTVSVTITSHGATTATAAPSVTSSSSKGGGSRRDLVLFGAVAGTMLAIIGRALVWRRTHGR